MCIAAVATAFAQAVPSSHTSGEVNNYKSLRDVPTLQLLPPALQVSCSRLCLQADNVAQCSRLPKKYAQSTKFREATKCTAYSTIFRGYIYR